MDSHQGGQTYRFGKRCSPTAGNASLPDPLVRAEWRNPPFSPVIGTVRTITLARHGTNYHAYAPLSGVSLLRLAPPRFVCSADSGGFRGQVARKLAPLARKLARTSFASSLGQPQAAADSLRRARKLAHFARSLLAAGPRLRLGGWALCRLRRRPALRNLRCSAGHYASAPAPSACAPAGPALQACGAADDSGFASAS